MQSQRQRLREKSGAWRFLNLSGSPFDSVTVRSRVKNIVDLFKYKNRLEEKVRIQTDNLKRQNKLLEQQTIKIKENNENIIDVLGTVVEYRNLESGEHIKRVKGFTRILARACCPEVSGVQSDPGEDRYYRSGKCTA